MRGESGSPRRKVASTRRSTGEVLQFAGVKRFNYDRDEVLEKWQEDMRDIAWQLLVDIGAGKITGLMVATTTNGQDDGPRDAVASGIFAEDLGWAADIAEQMGRGLRRSCDDVHGRQ
jgi:hypothetical protein